jgi:hypothetical protein
MANHPTEANRKSDKWNWIGQALRKEVAAVEKTALDCNPQGSRRRERGEG